MSKFNEGDQVVVVGGGGGQSVCGAGTDGDMLHLFDSDGVKWYGWHESRFALRANNRHTLADCLMALDLAELLFREDTRFDPVVRVVRSRRVFVSKDLRAKAMRALRELEAAS